MIGSTATTSVHFAAASQNYGRGHLIARQAQKLAKVANNTLSRRPFDCAGM
jgi:hypothetical protein